MTHYNIHCDARTCYADAGPVNIITKRISYAAYIHGIHGIMHIFHKNVLTLRPHVCLKEKFLKMRGPGRSLALSEVTLVVVSADSEGFRIFSQTQRGTLDYLVRWRAHYSCSTFIFLPMYSHSFFSFFTWDTASHSRENN